MLLIIYDHLFNLRFVMNCLLLSEHDIVLLKFK